MWLFKRNSEKRNLQETLNIDNDEFLIQGGALREYRGDKDTIIVPRGVERIYNDDCCICSHSIDTICIPKTVLRIGDHSLPFCESVLYEGSEYEWKNISIGSDNFTTGWRPDWCKEPPMDKYRVTEVKFFFNATHPWGN